MADYDFQCTAVTGGYAGVVQRGAVLYPLLGLAKDAHGIFGKTLKLVDCWRARLRALGQFGWHAKGERPGDQYARNCPPPFAMIRPQSRLCCRDVICPFCYARWACKVWRAVDAAFPNARDVPATERTRRIDLGEPRPPVQYPYHLIERHFENLLPFTEDGKSYTDYVRWTMQTIAERRREPIDAYKPLGCFHFATVTPCEQRNQSGWLVHIRVLAMVPATHPTPIWTGTIQRITEPSRREVLNSVIRVCKYPRALMYGDAEMTATMLNARCNPQRHSSIRLAASYGAFRNSRGSSEA